MIIRESKDVRQSVAECFASDLELIDLWHVAAGSGLDACIEKTMQDVATTFDGSFQFYTAHEGGELAGYWGVEFGNYIDLIFVKPKFRNQPFMREFWKAIQDTVSEKFFTAVYSKNEPAVSFYSKRGRQLESFNVGEHRFTGFEFHKEGDSCQQAG